MVLWNSASSSCPVIGVDNAI